MADTIRLAQYFKMKAANRPGQAARALGALQKAGVNLLAFSGFPRGGQAQLDFVVTSAASFKAAAKRAKLKVQGPKACLLIQGDDRRGAGAKLTGKLAAAKVNVTALQAISTGGRYAAILFVKPGAVKKAARALGAR
ncbi:MAG: hypothetical protein EPO02_08490 [Nitrospirae bacterium]|nr:MAG: hypothetical protein EPO02_08490 [Nitrospirota bacterium]